MILATIAGAGLCWLALRDPRLRRAPRLLSAGVVLGILIVAGWIVTVSLVDEFAGPARPQSLTFVSTVGKALYAGLLNVANFADFGVASVFGVIAGSWLAAWRSAELRWEAFDDDHEMRRHLGGGLLMGIGGILAGGCTIGPGTDRRIDARVIRAARDWRHDCRRAAWYRHSGRRLAARHHSAPLG